MLDIKFIRENKEIVTLGAKKKRIAVDIDALIKLDDRRRELTVSSEKKRAEQNSFNDKISKSGIRDERNSLISEMKILKEALQKEEEELKSVLKDWQALMLQVPNIPDISVPDGATDADNLEIKTWGDKPEFNFELKDHLELMTALGMADFERGAKVHGFRGYFLTGSGAELSFAVWNYALDFFRGKGFRLVIPPTIVRKQNLYGTGHLPGDVEDYYVTQDGDTLAGTAEVPMMGFHSEEILNPADFPLKYLAFSPCFRREAGSHSKDVKGLIRVHEFYKFEQVVICEANHETSVKLHEEIERNTEEFIESLRIPYRTVINCGADLGLGQVKKYDVELWVPKEKKYREISSASYFHDFQCRRFNIRYKGPDGKTRYAHSLNNTAIPTPRILVSLVENNQQADGSIRVPEVLQKYFGREIIK
ncbi:MAG: Serine-tRNA ligase [candidate division CPR1 bacterium GW2011_GWA2_42_17]|uniref:Serine--tRNA ligase n=1 Tax=candidate division CPR1 bacterium GW2011_GWA2_42_17 TaxID=1618341 RepID=A0A0G0Z6E7_9BACT|nr:MAG: Serine-tRNA ligase [candidate division CPR1 bacterium GW2011_GWA2_42_17]